MSVLVILGRKCTLAASRAAPMSHVVYAPHTLLRLEIRWDRQTDGRKPDRNKTFDGHIQLRRRDTTPDTLRGHRHKEVAG